MSKCKICHTSHTRDELDEQGRCRSCHDAYMATLNGMHYGDYMPPNPGPMCCRVRSAWRIIWR